VTASAAFLGASADRAVLGSLGLPAARRKEADTAEGYLFPATYTFRQDSDPAELVRMLVRESDRRWQRLADRHRDALASLARTLGFGRREIVVLASLIEKEAAVAEERSLIASVFLNRLRGGMPRHLQSDPTAAYGCYLLADRVPACRGFDGRATAAINRDPQNPYSTYVVEGLPPGPITNPGEASLEAVLAPADTTYLYFVAKGGGRHEFSSDYDSHRDAVRRLRDRR
jgi:UPF0755 protein